MNIVPSRYRGYSLVEIVVTIVLMGVVSAFAVSRFDGGYDLAAARQAQGTADAAVSTMIRSATRTGSPSADPAALSTTNPDVGFVATTTPSPGPGTASVAVAGWRFGAAVIDSSGTCWVSVVNTGRRPDTASDRLYAAATGSPCDGNLVLALIGADVLATDNAGRSWSEPYACVIGSC